VIRDIDLASVHIALSFQQDRESWEYKLYMGILPVGDLRMRVRQGKRSVAETDGKTRSKASQLGLGTSL